MRYQYATFIKQHDWAHWLHTRLLRAPRRHEPVHLGRLREVLVNEVKHVVGRVGVRRQRLPLGGDVFGHGGARAEVRRLAARQEEGLVKAAEDRRRGRVYRAKDRCAEDEIRGGAGRGRGSRSVWGGGSGTHQSSGLRPPS